MRKPLSTFLIAGLFLATWPVLAGSFEPVRARHGMVASVSEIASRIGVDVMRKGGNAVDAAVAVGFALAVVWPEAGNLGGGGFLLMRKTDGTTEAIDYRERAPLAATRTMYLDVSGNVIPKASTQGYRAVAVPGTVAGLALAHKRHGKLKWSQLIAPARRLAAEGFLVSYALQRSLASTEGKRMASFEESHRIYLRGGRAYVMGDRFTQPELAATLARLQADPQDFYRGLTAKRIVADMKAHGGTLTMRDLEDYQPTVRQPLRGTYRGLEIITMPPPSSGGIALLEMLSMLEPYDLKAMGWHSVAEVHTMVEVMRRAFADRASFLGDTDFVKVPVSGLTSKAYAGERRKDIRSDRASTSKEVGAGNPTAYESPQTTHFTIVDGAGNVVTNTYTLNDTFGSGVTIKGTGVLMNDEMDDFTSKPGVPNLYGLIQGEANAIAPHKRPLSSMTPTIVVRDGKFWFATGSPGGSTIINTVLQIITNVVDFGMNIRDAVEAPRFHHQWQPDKIAWETMEFSAETWSALEAMGHIFAADPGLLLSHKPDTPNIGDAHAVMVDERGILLGASDPRRGGMAVGW
ncbi:MAG: gamma-glutamyltransferase [Thermoanaerobaculia bacterium]